MGTVQMFRVGCFFACIFALPRTRKVAVQLCSFASRQNNLSRQACAFICLVVLSNLANMTWQLYFSVPGQGTLK
jgi:hypothetical protein